MAVNERLNDFADISAAAIQFDYLEKRLEDYVDLMDKASKAGKISFDGLKGSGNLAEYNKNANTAVESTRKATAAVKDYTQALGEANDFLGKLSPTMRDNLKLQVTYENQLAQVKKQLKELKSDSGDYSAIVEKLTAEELGLKVALSEVRIALKQEEKELQANSGSVDELAVKVGRMKDAWRQLDAVERNSEGGQKMLAEIQSIDEAVKALNASTGNFQGNVGNYPNPIAELKAMREELVRLKLAGEDNSEEFDILTNKANRLGLAISEVGKLTQATGGSTTTASGTINKVSGNFQKATNAAYSFQQVLRETPAAAYSFSTYMSAISNNVPILVQHLQELKAANLAAKAAGEQTIPTWKVLAQSLFSFNGIATLAISAFTIFSARASMAGNSMSEAEKAASKLNDKLAELNETIRESYQTEIDKTSELLRVAQSLELPYKTRVDAITELIRLYPALLQQIDQEAFLTGKLGNAQEVLNNVTQKQLQVKRLEEQLNAIISERTRLTVELNKQEKEQASGFQGANSFSQMWDEITDNDPLEPQRKAIKAFDKDVNMLQESLKLTRQELSFMLNPEHEGRILSDIDAEIKKFEALRDANAITTDEHKRAIIELKRLETERRAFLDKPQKKVHEQRDNTLKNEQNLTAELYSEYAKRLQIDAQYQKAISEDETLSMEERITAYRKYTELTFQAQGELLSARQDQIQQSLDAIEVIEGKSAGKRTKQEKELLARKAVFQQQYNTLLAEYDLLREQDIEKTSKGILSIQENETKKRLDSLRALSNNVELQEAQSLETLNASLRDGTISYKEYTRRRREIESSFQKEKQKQIIAYLSEEIDLLSKQGVNVASLQEALNEANKRLYDTDLQNFIEKERAKADAKKQIDSKINELVGEGIQTVQALNDASYEKQLAQIANKLTAIDEQKSAEIAQINDSLLSEEQKNKRVRALEAQAAAEKRQLQQEEARIKRNQAISDRVAAGTQVIYGTAVAVINAMKIPPPAGQILAGIVAGIGGLQAARIARAPLPAYADGTPVGGHPADGPARIGEAGPEVVKEPNKAPYVASHDQVRWLPKGTRVFNQEQVVRDMSLMAGLSPALVRNMQLQAGGVNMELSADIEGLKAVHRQEGAAIRRAIADKQETHFHWSNGELRQSVRNGNNWTHYIGKNLNKH